MLGDTFYYSLYTDHEFQSTCLTLLLQKTLTIIIRKFANSIIIVYYTKKAHQVTQCSTNASVYFLNPIYFPIYDRVSICESNQVDIGIEENRLYLFHELTTFLVLHNLKQCKIKSIHGVHLLSIH